MQGLFPIFFAFLAGAGHAFEPDHLLAVGNLVSRRDTLAEALRDGIYWGLGHTMMLVLVGSVILLGRVTFLSSGYFEMAIGGLLILMGLGRLLDQRKPPKVRPGSGRANWAFTIGLLHGLAGSGALVLLVMSGLQTLWLGILYFLVFGIGSMLGMTGVAGLCSIPFTRRMKINRWLKAGTVTLSSLACVAYGGWMVYLQIINYKL